MDAMDGFPRLAPELRPPVVFDQRWCDLTFVHWPVRPSSVAELFPPGTRPDVFDDGMTYVALVPFVLRSAGFRPGAAVPYLGTFLETNVRLYSVDAAGHHGVVFRSLDTARSVIVPFARAAFGMPYAWSRMRMSRSGDLVRYESLRRWPRGSAGDSSRPRSTLVVRIGPRLEPTELEVWLTARWGAHSRWAGRTLWVPNRHEQWPLYGAEIEHLDDELLAASGVPVAGPQLRALWSPGVHAQFGLPRRIDETARL